MFITLTGVLDDGPDRASGVPPNPRIAMRWPLGSTIVIRLDAVSKRAGSKIDLVNPAGQIIKLEVRLQPLPLNVQKLIEVTAVALNPPVVGAVQFTISPATQKPIQQQNISRAFFDVWRILADGTRDALIPTSPLYFEPSVTEIP